LQQQLIAAVLVSIIAFCTVYWVTPLLIKQLEKVKSTVKDYNRIGGAMVARPGGPSIIAGILVSEIVLYAFFPSVEIIAISITTGIAFLVGLVDDRRVMGGWFKPIALAVATFPILLFGVYDSDLAFPLFGEVQIPLLYIGIVIFMIPITGNTINSIDVLNGVVKVEGCS